MRDTKQKLTPVTIGLHWVVALTIILLLIVGFYMANTKTFALYPIHKSIGALIFFVVIARVIWRIKNGWPVPLKDDNKMELLLAKVVHWLLMIGTVLLPLSGMTMSAASGRGVFIFDLQLFAKNPDLANPGKIAPLNAGLAEFAASVHSLAGYVLATAIILHIGGALKHHFVYKDDTLARMKGKDLSE